MSVKILTLCWALLAALPATAQGFADLGRSAEGFTQPAPGVDLSFPADHGPHPDYRIEWWYLTATLTGEDGQDYGVQWTLFRSALQPNEAKGWQSPQLWMGHAALTTDDAHYYAERLARGGIGQAGVTASPFEAWIDEWTMRGRDDLSSLSVNATGAAFGYALEMTAKTPLVLHGDQGYSVKSGSGQASYYYAQPSYAVTGTLQLPDGPVNVTGNGWLDREWSSQPLAADQTGWDWFSLAMDDGARLMGFLLRDSGDGYSSATWIAPDGSVQVYGDGAFTATPLATALVEGRDIPVRWRVELPAKGVDVEISALNPQSWMATSFAYWEGPIEFTGSHQGRGYLEMTGYE
ncbi:MAG: putative secreted hydrolase [Paracoccaceae bacterium]|jgi:predicted secreted hydrolase